MNDSMPMSQAIQRRGEGVFWRATGGSIELNRWLGARLAMEAVGIQLSSFPAVGFASLS